MLDIRTEIANALDWDIAAIPRHRVTANVDGSGVTLQGVRTRGPSPRRTCAECLG